MKKVLLIVAALIRLGIVYSQVAIGTTVTTPDPNAMLDIQSNSKGVLPPRLSNTAIMGMTNPTPGMVAFNTDLQCLMIYRGIKWECIGTSSSHPLQSVNSVVQSAIGTGTSEVLKIRVASDGTYYVVGKFTGNLTLGAFELTNVSAFNYGFAAKYNADGTVNWAVQFTTNDQIDPGDMELDAAGNMYITGSYQGSVSLYLPNGQLSQSLATASTGTHMFLMKMTTEGSYDWAIVETSFTPGFVVSGNGLCLTRDKVMVTGSFTSTAVFGSGSNFTNLSSTGDHDIFVVSYDTADARLDWAQRKGGAGRDAGVDLVTSLNRLYVTGYFSGTVTFVSSPVAVVGQEDIFRAVVDTSTLTWSSMLQIGGSGSDIPANISSSGTQIALAGVTTGSVPLGGLYTIEPGEFVLITDFSLGTIGVVSLGFGTQFLNEAHMSGNYNVSMTGSFSDPMPLNNGYTLLAKDNSSDIFYIQSTATKFLPIKALAVPGSGIQSGNSVVRVNNISYVAGHATGICSFGNFVHDFGPNKTMFIWKIFDN